MREPQPPVREDYRSSFEFCKAERAFLGDAAFSEKYGTNLALGAQRVRQVR